MSGNRGGRAQVVDIINILVVNMVSEEKCAKVKKKKKSEHSFCQALHTVFAKPCTFQGGNSSSDSSADGFSSNDEQGHTTNTTRNMRGSRMKCNRDFTSSSGNSYENDGMEISLGSNGQNIDVSFETAGDGAASL